MAATSYAIFSLTFSNPYSISGAISRHLLQSLFPAGLFWVSTGYTPAESGKIIRQTFFIALTVLLCL